jgi:hypothetical protein
MTVRVLAQDEGPDMGFSKNMTSVRGSYLALDNHDSVSPKVNARFYKTTAKNPKDRRNKGDRGNGVVFGTSPRIVVPINPHNPID